MLHGYKFSVSQTLLVRKYSKSEESDDCSSTISSYNTSQTGGKKSKLENWFSSKEPLEEELTLLPVYKKENDHIKVVKKVSSNDYNNDWWTRFFYSNDVINTNLGNVDNVTRVCLSLSFI